MVVTKKDELEIASRLINHLNQTSDS